LKPSSIYRWADEVDIFEHIGLRSRRTSRGFWGTTKSRRLRCQSLLLFVKVTGIIWSVVKLGHMNLNKCGELRSLPPSFGGLTKLKVLNISGSGVEELPEVFGELQSLVDFNASGCSSLSRLPESFGQLPNLQRLDLAPSLWQTSKPTYIFWWTREVANSEYIVLRIARTSGGFWGTTKSCRFQC